MFQYTQLYNFVKRRGRIQLVEQWVVQVATGNPDQDIPWPPPSGVHDLAMILDELVKAQPRVIGRTAKPGTQAWPPLRDTVGWQREISAGNAKQGDFSMWGVAHNGSDGRVVRTRRDCLCGPRGRTRVSVCKETEISYLTRTEDLKSNSQSGVVLVEKVLPFFTISLALRTCGWAMDVMTF
ncbi:hypothetical protein SI65_05332 [Aspergillus cristatus]|uniref:Uncharacterized protein n=1 Tax=Aspergillus cristatus TaxID=573508 RepID=A0A1E3BCL7_ASPCR|nr:hypothetical protein SI65_05332 [Aspergillus cristatus]